MRVLIVDDHEIVRRGIRSALRFESTLSVCGEAADGIEAIEKARSLKPDVITMDISMPNLGGLEATRRIKQLQPEAQVIIVSQHDAPEMMRLATEAGALSYVTKSTVSTDLLKVIRSLNHSGPTSSGLPMAANGENSKASRIPQDGAQETSFKDEDSVPLAIETLDGRRTQELESAAEQLRDLSGKVLRAQDEERRRI